MFKKLIPTSLLARFILIILLPTIFTQLIATYIFYNRHWDSITRNMSYSLYSDILVANEIQKQNLESEFAEKITKDLNIDLYSEEIPKNRRFHDYSPPETITLYLLLKKSFAHPINISFDKDNNQLFIKILLKEKILVFKTNSKRINSSTSYIFILWMTGTSLFFLFFSIIFTKNQIRPIIKLARAADRFGKGQPQLDLKLEGAAEIRKAASAFNKMKERIEKQITSRTEMLAGISHDLRTPLTRMKLQLAVNPQAQAMAEDIKDLEDMVNAYLDFARGDNKEEIKSTNLVKFINTATSAYKNNNLIIEEIPNIKVRLKANSLKRCFQNLLDNAFRYGNKALLCFYVIDDDIKIVFHDDGPGIPENKREDVFKPFYRLDESRNKDTGGTGLGLAITRDIIINHGGSIELGESELLKGLKVIISLPQ